jgi:putative ABC transport system substrate-binding protein
MNRRLFFQLPLVALAVPLRLHAQSARKPARIGVLSSSSPESRSTFWEAFKDGMAKRGWIEGRDVTYIYRYARGDSSRFDALAAELVAEKPDVIFASTQSAALAVKRATREIPMVFALVNEPVETGLVASLARPGGNATGLTGASVETRTKTLELLREIVPKLRRIAVLVSPGELGKQDLRSVGLAARTMHIEVDAMVVGNQDELNKALQWLGGKRPDGVLLLVTGVITRGDVAKRMTELRLPAIYPISEWVRAGGPISYGVELSDNFRRAAEYVDRILKGTKPGDLPVQQPTVFELAVNLKTARAQGITIPQSVLLRATTLID